MSEVNTGITCLYGISPGQLGSVFVQSYTVTSNFNNTATVVMEDGLTVTARYDDRKTEITVEGIAKSSSLPALGASFSFTANSASSYPNGAASTSFSGTVIKLDDKGSSKGFSTVSITAESYEAI